WATHTSASTPRRAAHRRCSSTAASSKTRSRTPDRMPRQLISSGGPWEDRAGYSRAVRVGDRVWVSGSTGVEPDGAIPEDPARQAQRALEVIAAALGQVGAALADVVVARIY